MSDDRATVSFRDWKTRLAGREGTPEEKQQAARGIIGFLRHCKELHSPACIGVVKSYLAKMESQARSGTLSPRPALRWFFMAAANQGRPVIRFTQNGRSKSAPLRRSEATPRRRRRALTGVQRWS